jgi:hypothetical protein
MDLAYWDAFADRHRRAIFAITGGIAGLLQAWHSRGIHSPDLINYLALARALLSNGWNSATNAFWSPLYSWLLAIPMASHLVTPRTELLWVHVINLGVFFASMLCFHVFLAHSLRLAAIRVGPNFPAWQKIETPLYLSACAIFLFATLNWLPNSLCTPDLLVASFIFLSAGFFASILCGDRTWPDHFVLGAALALGYLAKAPAFPLAILFFLMLLVFSRAEKHGWLKCLASVAAFVLIAGPFLYTLSKKESRFTFGDSGRVSYLMYADGLPAYWLGEGIPGGKRAVNYRTLCTDPTVYAFREAPPGVFYPAFDPSQWYAGLVPTMNVRQEASNLRDGFHTLGPMAEAETDLILGFVILLLIAGWKTGLKSVLGWWFLWLPAACGIAMFWLVHVEERFIAPFIVLGCLGLYLGALVPACKKPTIVRTVLLAVLLVQGARVGIIVFKEFLSVPASSTTAAAKVVQDLNTLGVPPKSKIALIGNPLGPYWAWMGQYSIVGALPSSGTPRFLGAGPNEKLRTYACMEKTGALAAVIYEGTPELLGPGWVRVGPVNLYARLLSNDANQQLPATTETHDPTATGISGPIQ